MFVSKVTLRFWHGWAAAWSGKRLQIYHEKEETSSRSGLESSAIKKKKKKPKAKGSREKTNKRDIFLEKCSVCFPLGGGNLALSLFPSLSLSLHHCVSRELHRGSWLGDAARHTEHVIRAATGIPQATGFTFPEHKSASHTKETPTRRLHTKPKHVADCSMQGQPRQRHRNRKSVTASHTWHELHTGSLFDTTAAAAALEASHCLTCTDRNQPVLTTRQLCAFTWAGSNFIIQKQKKIWR